MFDGEEPGTVAADTARPGRPPRPRRAWGTRGAWGLCVPLGFGAAWCGPALIVVAAALALLVLTLAAVVLGAAFAPSSTRRRACRQTLEQILTIARRDAR